MGFAFIYVERCPRWLDYMSSMTGVLLEERNCLPFETTWYLSVSMLLIVSVLCVFSASCDLDPMLTWTLC